MKIWFDVDNAPHALLMKPLSEGLLKQGHLVKFTARDRANTCQILDLYGITFDKIGGVYGSSTLHKVIGTIRRAFQLRTIMKDWQADVSFGHGSRSLPIASKLLGIPSITMYDYEWVNPSIFNKFCSKILLPDAISIDRCRDSGIDVSKVCFFPGFKENLYLSEAKPDPSIAEELHLKSGKRKVLLRPPATTAHYHNPESERILIELLRNLLNDSNVQLVWIPRTQDQNILIEGDHSAELIIPAKVYPGPQLILSMDMVIGGGGTMTREAAILGITSGSFFMGETGMVDEALVSAGRLILLRSTEDAQIILEQPVARRSVLHNPASIKTIQEYILGE